MTTALAIVAVSYGSTALLEHNLTRVAEEVPEAAVIVVDNRSSDTERKAAEQLTSERGWALVAPDDNLGFGGGVNLGIERARALGHRDFLVINPDATINAASVKELEVVTRADRTTLAAPVIKTPTGTVWFAGLDLYLRDGTIRAPRRRSLHPDEPHVEWLTGACLWITEEVWAATGGFDHDYFLYWEDVDFSRRAVAAGCSLRVVEEAVAVHDEGLTHRTSRMRAEAKSEIYYYYNIRNRMLFACGHLDGDGIRRWRRTALRNAYQVLRRGGRRQFLRPVAPVRAAVRGVWDGVRIANSALREETHLAV